MGWCLQRPCDSGSRIKQVRSRPLAICYLCCLLSFAFYWLCGLITINQLALISWHGHHFVWKAAALLWSVHRTHFAWLQVFLHCSVWWWQSSNNGICTWLWCCTLGFLQVWKLLWSKPDRSCMWIWLSCSSRCSQLYSPGQCPGQSSSLQDLVRLWWGTVLVHFIDSPLAAKTSHVECAVLLKTICFFYCPTRHRMLDVECSGYQCPTANKVQPTYAELISTGEINCLWFQLQIYS